VNLEGIELVSWDLDGTFYPVRTLEWLSNLAFLQRWREHGWRAARDEAFRAKRHRKRVHRQRQGEAKVERDPDYAADAEALVLYVCRALKWVKPDPKALALMDRIAAAGIPQVAVSDFAAPQKLESLGIRHRFAAAYSCDELGHWKPSPLPFLYVQRAHQVAPARHLHLGDREDMDGRAAIAAGCRFLLHRAGA
jgi:FMN phosphatase YigB (HAD superfamily)